MRLQERNMATSSKALIAVPVAERGCFTSTPGCNTAPSSRREAADQDVNFGHLRVSGTRKTEQLKPKQLLVIWIPPPLFPHTHTGETEVAANLVMFAEGLLWSRGVPQTSFSVLLWWLVSAGRQRWKLQHLVKMMLLHFLGYFLKNVDKILQGKRKGRYL